MSRIQTKDQFVLRPAGLLRITIATTAVLVALHLIGLFLEFGLGRDYALGFVPLFDMESEQNAPTLYNSILLVGAGILALLAGKSAPEFRWRWRFIGSILIAMGIDETYGLHEPVFFVLRGNESEGTAAWVEFFAGLEFSDLLPWLIALAALIIWWCWPLIRQAGRISILGICAGSIYLFGALGLDLLTSAERAGELSLGAIVVIGTIEEIAELVGASLFVYAISLYIVEVQRTEIVLSGQS